MQWTFFLPFWVTLPFERHQKIAVYNFFYVHPIPAWTNRRDQQTSFLLLIWVHVFLLKFWGAVSENRQDSVWKSISRPWGRGQRVEIFRQADLYINDKHIIQGFRISMLPSLFPSMSPWIRAINAPCSFLIKLSDWRQITKNAGGHFFHWLSFCDFAMIFSK